MTLMYRWALAHERAQNAWRRASMQRKHAHAVAVAYARELSLPPEERSKSRAAWAEIYFEQPADPKGVWDWTTA